MRSKERRRREKLFHSKHSSKDNNRLLCFAEWGFSYKFQTSGHWLFKKYDFNDFCRSPGWMIVLFAVVFGPTTENANGPSELPDH